MVRCVCSVEATASRNLPGHVSIEPDGDATGAGDLDQDRYVYDPYGNLTIYLPDWSDTRDASSYDWTVLFAGYWRDAETGLYHVRHRMYHVRLGLWLTRDPEGYVDGMSLYAYVGGNPLTALDPLGEGAWDTVEDLFLDVGHSAARTLRDSPTFASGYMPSMPNSQLGQHAEGVLNRYETYRSEHGGDFAPVAAWVRANVDRVLETAMDCVPVAGSAWRAGTGYKMDDQQYPAVQVEMSEGERYFHMAKAGVEAGLVVSFAAARQTVGGGKRADAPNRATGQTVGDLRAAGSKDARHVIQDAAVRDVPGYNTNAAPGVQFPGPSSAKGTPHYRATQVQRQPGGGTYAAERRIGYKALRRGGLSKDEARRAIQHADDYFRSLRVGSETPTRIPGNRQ